jgi:hypothetical protein
MRLHLIFLTLILILAACGSDDGGDATNQALPTLAEVAADATEEATEVMLIQVATETNEPTATEVVEESPTVEPSNTVPPTATFRPPPTQTPAPTIDRTRAAIGTGTAAVEEAVIISTVTAGANSPVTTPMAVADVVITAAQFQEEVSLRIEDIQEIESARVRMISSGILPPPAPRRSNSATLCMVASNSRAAAPRGGHKRTSPGSGMTGHFR